MEVHRHQRYDRIWYLKKKKKIVENRKQTQFSWGNFD